MALTSTLLRFVTSRSSRRFETATHDPVAVQKKKILGIVHRNRETAYGVQYDFGSIRSIEDYQRNVPMVSYEDIRSYVEKVVNHGEKQVLTAEEPVMFAQTSATTGDAKYIPVTPTCQGREHSDVMRTWLNHAQKAHPDIFDKKIVSLVSPAIEGHTPCGVPFGSTSGQIYKNMSPFVRRAYSIPYEVFEIPDYEAKYYSIMRISLEHDVRFLSTANPSSIIKMCEKADEYSEQIMKDIHDGTITSNIDMPSEIRSQLETLFAPNPSRAGELEEFNKRRSGLLLPADYWPSLSLIGCWKGGTVGHTVERFQGWFNPDGDREVPVRDWGYLSSEARASIPLSDEGSAGVLTIASNFFEFVDVEELEKNPDDPSTWNFLHVGEIEDGGEYYIFLTTTGGLYRYDINDVIQVKGYYNSTPQVVFLRKGRGMTNITGEKVSVNQVIQAITECGKKLEMGIEHYKAEAEVEGARYIFKIECDRSHDKATHLAFLRAVDAQLKDINIEYKSKRDSQRLENPVLHVMRQGWYENSRKAWVGEGKRQFQAKTVYLSAADPDSADDDLEMIVGWDD